MRPAIEIRSAEPIDEAAIARLAIAAGHGFVEALLGGHAADIDSLVAAYVDARLRRSGSLSALPLWRVAVEDGSVLGAVNGFVHASLATFEPDARDPKADTGWLAALDDLESAAGGYFVNSLAVEPATRRSGVGRRLIADCHLAARALGQPFLSLVTFAGDRRAMDFYAATGFAEVERRPPLGHPLLAPHGALVLLRCPVAPAA